MIAVDFLKTYAIKIALVLIVFVAGAALGYKLGYDSAWSTQQATINKMAKAENDRRDSDNSRLNNAEQGAPKLTQQAEAKTQVQVQYRDRIVKEYYTRNPSPEVCAWSAPTVNLINQVLDGTKDPR